MRTGPRAAWPRVDALCSPPQQSETDSSREGVVHEAITDCRSYRLREVLSTLEHRGHSRPARGGRNQGRPTSSTCPLQSCPLTHSQCAGLRWHRDPRATERDGPCVRPPCGSAAALFTQPYFLNLLGKYHSYVSHLPLLSTCKPSTVAGPQTKSWDLGFSSRLCNMATCFL